MGWGEKVAQSIASKQARRSSERDAMWAKLMDIANMGKGVWETLSGRQYATEAREDEQAYGTNERLGGQTFGAGESAKDRAFNAEQGLYNKAFSAKENALDRAARLAETKAGKNPNEGELQRRLNEALSTITTLNPDFVIPDPNNPVNSILDLTKAKDIKDAVLAFFEDPAERAWAERQLDLTIARWKPGEQIQAQITQTPTFNPPPEAKPTKPAFADVKSLAQKLVKARAVAGADPESKRVLDYIQAQMPTASNPRGGPDYSKNPIEWAAKASETINRILGIVAPQNQTPSMKGMGNTLLK